jgi:hypothetical protein
MQGVSHLAGQHVATELHHNSFLHVNVYFGSTKPTGKHVLQTLFLTQRSWFFLGGAVARTQEKTVVNLVFFTSVTATLSGGTGRVGTNARSPRLDGVGAFMGPAYVTCKSVWSGKKVGSSRGADSGPRGVGSRLSVLWTSSHVR